MKINKIALERENYAKYVEQRKRFQEEERKRQEVILYHESFNWLKFYFK